MQKSGHTDIPSRRPDDERDFDDIRNGYSHKQRSERTKEQGTSYVPYEDAVYYRGAKRVRSSPSPPFSETNRSIHPKELDSFRVWDEKHGNRWPGRQLDDESDYSDSEYDRVYRVQPLPARRRSRSRGRRSPSRSRTSKSKSRKSIENVDPRNLPTRPSEAYTPLKAAKCAALGAALEAFRARNEPGPWMGQKAQRLALAAAAGVAVGSVRGGQLQSSGALPYAEALCTGFFAVEWYKKIGRHTEHVEKAKQERQEWKQAYENKKEEFDKGVARDRQSKR